MATEPAAPPAAPRFELAQVPLVTAVLCAVCIAVFAAITVSPPPQTWDGYAAFGYLSPFRIWDGGYWGLVSSAFVHLTLWHLVFNVYWFWTLGGLVERQIGPMAYIAFILAAALVSSAVQLAVSDETGHGASGVVYGFFGLMWAARRQVPAFTRRIDDQTSALFWLWLVGCIVATRIGAANFGNGAHVSGLALGILVSRIGLVSARRVRYGVMAAAGVAALSMVPVVWSPWSGGWVGYKAYKADVSGDYETAFRLYRRSIDLGGSRLWALENMALAYHARGDSTGLAGTLAEIRSFDPASATRIEAEIEGATERKDVKEVH